VRAGKVCVVGEVAIGDEVFVALHGEAEAATHGFQFGDAHVAQLWLAQPAVAETEGEVWVLRVELREQPGRVGVRREEVTRRRPGASPCGPACGSSTTAVPLLLTTG
jgi:hypothetical protein